MKINQFDEYSVEDLYRHVHGVRKQVLGISALEKAWELRASQGLGFDPAGGIDQRQKKSERLVASQQSFSYCFKRNCLF